MSTHFQLDYVTGEAMVSNRQPDEQQQVIMTSVEAVGSSGLPGDIQERIGTIRGVCEIASIHYPPPPALAGDTTRRPGRSFE